MAQQPLRRDARRALDQQRNLGPTGHVHLRAHRADLRNESHHPAEFRLRGGIEKRIGEFRPSRGDQQPLAARLFPQLFGDERHHRVQQMQRTMQHPERGGARLGLRRFISAIQDRLDEFEIPVAVGAPDELVAGVRGVVEAELLEGGGDAARGFRKLRDDPAVDREPVRRGIEALRVAALVHLAEARRVPDFRREIAVALEPPLRHLHVAALRTERGEREPQRVGAVFLDEVERVERVAPRLRHLGALGVAHHAVQEHVMERHFLHEVHAHHHHARDPEKQDVPAGHEHVGGIVAREFGRLLGPAERRERPERRGEPCVEHVGIARERHVAAELRLRLRLGAGLVVVDEHGAVLGVPGGNLMAPPELARDAPGLDVLHPVEERLLLAFGHDLDAPVAHGIDRLGGQGLRVGVPLHGHIGLDRHPRAVAVRHGVRVRLDLLDEALGLERGHDALARLETVQPAERLGHRLVQARIGGHDVDRLEAVAFADLEIVEVMRRRDLHRARAGGGIGIVVGDDPDAPAHERQDRVLADEILVALVGGVHRDAGVAEHRLGPRGRDGDELARPPLDRILEVPEMALHLALLDLEVGDRGLELRVPVHEPPVAIDEARAMELDEHLQHGGREPFIHREALAAPVGRGAETAELLQDRAARDRLPFPDALHELVAADQPRVAQRRATLADRLQLHAVVAFRHAAAREPDPFGRELTLHDHLRRDAGVVGAGLPERVAAGHAPVADQHVLQRVVERVTDVEAARDVGRRDHDRERARAVVARLERARLFPAGILPGLHGLGAEPVVEHDMALQ